MPGEVDSCRDLRSDELLLVRVCVCVCVCGHMSCPDACPNLTVLSTAALPDATAPQMNVIMALAEPEPNGLVVYSTVVSWSFKSLQWLVEQEMIADRI